MLMVQFREMVVWAQFGVVRRSETVESLVSSAMIFSHIVDPLILETLACRETQALANDLLIQ